MIFADAHIHITDLALWQPIVCTSGTHKGQASPVCSCAHCEADWKKLAEYADRFPASLVRAAGVHPQDPDKKHIPFLLKALETGTADAVGEAGFDLFTPEYAVRLEEQEAVWALQLEAAERYAKPLIVHCRKALHLIFRDAKKLAKLPAVIFHSFPGSPLEALSLVKRRIPARFSFGKPLLNGNKRALQCAAVLPFDLLLAETDAPWQSLKNEGETAPSDIKKIYARIAELRGVKIEAVCEILYKNFKDCFAVF